MDLSRILPIKKGLSLICGTKSVQLGLILRKQTAILRKRKTTRLLHGILKKKVVDLKSGTD